MKRTIAAACLLVSLVTGASASVSINWFSFNSVSLPTEAGGGLLGTDAIAILRWSADNIADVDMENPFTADGINEINLLYTNFGAKFNAPGNITVGAVNADGSDYGVGSGGLEDGYAYSILINAPFGLTTFTAGTWFGISPPTNLTSGGVIPESQKLTVNGTTGQPDVIDIDPSGNSGFTLNLQTVPEPGVMVLFGAGLSMIAFIRLRRRS